MREPGNEDGRLVGEALAALGIRRFALAVHDASFPGRDDEDLGRGSPCSDGAADFLAFARGLGFDAIQLGPQGLTSASNPSPYDGTVFSRNPLSLALGPLTRDEEGLLPPEALAEAVRGRPADRVHVDQARVHAAQHRLLRLLGDRFAARGGFSGERGRDPLADRLADFRRRNAAWLEPDALYEPLCACHGQPYWRDWRDGSSPHPDQRLFAPEPGAEEQAARRQASLLAEHADEVGRFALVQLLLHEQHARLRRRCAALGLRLYGDLQVGLSALDVWARQAFLLGSHVMGAPPSRTNPEGQPWGYAVLDPRQYGPPGARGPALAFLAARMDKMFAEFDGVRIDHPHGLVDPWVYRPGQADPLRAVQGGARLFSSPDLADHPELAPFAVARPEQLDRSPGRHADGWVRELDDEQVRRYGAAFEVLAETCRRRGRATTDLLCEVLSTEPYPLRRVRQLHGLGRFRVTQKADLRNPADGYRGENAAEEDWIMVGNHDTPPVWALVEAWALRGELPDRAAYLATRLVPEGGDREAFARGLLRRRGDLVQAQLADLFAGPARNVMVFFADLLGLTEVYNRPGTGGERNWGLRVSPGYRAEHAARVRESLAFDVPRALALAFRARGAHFAEAHAGLLSALETRAGGRAS